jgi:glycosyltransferase involved in cell wall biosynthesis
MQILCVHQSAELYGSDRSFVQSVMSIRSLYPNANITVIVPKDGPLIPYMQKHCDKIIFEDVGAIARADLKNPFLLIKKVLVSSLNARRNMSRYDLVYVNTLVVMGYILGAIFSSKQIINHIREIPSQAECFIYSLIFRFNGSSLLFNSKYTRDSFLFLSQKRAYILHNGVPPIECETKLLSKPIQLLLIGRINSWKGQEVALEAVSILKNKGIAVSLRIVGGVAEGQDFYLEKIENLIKELGIGDVVKIHAFTAKPNQHFEWANIVLVPSTKPEPFGRVAIEAMSASCPVIASNHGGLVEILEGGKGGVLVTPGSAFEIVKAIEDITIDELTFQQFSRAALERYNSFFSQQIYVKKFKKIINEIRA